MKIFFSYKQQERRRRDEEDIDQIGQGSQGGF